MAFETETSNRIFDLQNTVTKLEKEISAKNKENSTSQKEIERLLYAKKQLEFDLE